MPEFTYFIQFEFWSPQLHQHLHLHSTCHLYYKTYPLTPDLHWHQYLHLWSCGSCTGYCIHTTSTNKCLHHFVHASLYTTTFPRYPLLTTSTLYLIITNTWPSYSLLQYLLPFSTNQNLSFIHTYSHASILHVILPLIIFLIRSFLVSAITTSHLHTTTPMARQLWIIWIKLPWQSQNSKGFNAEPCCIPTFTSKTLQLP